MTERVTRFVGRLPHGEIVLALPPSVSSVILSTHYRMVGEPTEVHRTEVSDMEGDIFDRLTLEMGNDAVAKNAVERIESISEMLAAQLANSINAEETIFIRLDEDVCSNFLFWINNLYVYSRKDEVDSSVVGVAQDLESDPDADEVSLSEEARLLMLLAEELGLAWNSV